MANSDTSDLLQKLVVGVVQARWHNYTLVPSITLMLFDWFLTLNMEVSLVWNSSWNTTKLLFLLTRYSAFIDIPFAIYYEYGYALPQHICEVVYKYIVWSFIIGEGFAILILTMRTWAVCGKGKISAYKPLGIFGITLAAILVLAGIYLRSSKFQESPVPQYIGCMVEANSLYLAPIYVIYLFYDGSLLLLMIVQGIPTFREAGNLQLTRVVYRDGILYYVYVFGLSLVNIVVMYKLHDAYITMLMPIQRITYSILACRVVLHIREQGQQGQQGGTIMSEQVTESIQFAQITQWTGRVTTGVSEEFRGEF